MYMVPEMRDVCLSVCLSVCVVRFWGVGSVCVGVGVGVWGVEGGNVKEGGDWGGDGMDG